MILVIIYDMVGEWVATISNNIAGYMDDVHWHSLFLGYAHYITSGNATYDNIDMENGMCVDDLPIEMVVLHSYVSHYQRVVFTTRIHYCKPSYILILGNF